MGVVSIFFVMGCATTSVKSVWKDPEFHRRSLTKTVVIGVHKKATLRRTFEDLFVEEFKKRGIEAEVSYRLFPDDLQQSKEQMMQTLAAEGVDSVLVTRLVDKKTLETYVPGSATYMRQPTVDLYGYYSTVYAYEYQPGYTIQQDVAVLETNVYLTLNEKLVWSGNSETLINGSVNDRLVKNVVKSLSNEFFKNMKPRK